MTSRSKCLALALSVTAVFSACRTTPDTESGAKADFEDASPEGSQSWTEARIFAFNKYAQDLLSYEGNEATKYNELALQLQQSLATAGVKQYDPLSTYSIQLGNYGECFGPNPTDFGIWWTPHRDQIKKQIEEVAFFVRDFHYILLGKSKGAFAFREVVICPEEKIGAKMMLQGYKLFIGVPFRLGQYRPISNQGSGVTLRSLWDEGHPIGLGNTGKGLTGKVRSLFSSEEKAKQAMKTLWTLFNPLSQARQALRRLLHETRGGILPALLSLRGTLSVPSPSPEARASLLDLAFPERATPDASLASDAARLEADSGEVLQRAADNWKCALERPDPIADLENDAMAMVQDNIKNTDVSNDVVAGLVAVVNHHDVAVLVSLGTGEYTPYLDASVIQDFKVTSRVRAGLVAVSTSDNISIDVRFFRSGSKALRAATFNKALTAARRGESLCP